MRLTLALALTTGVALAVPGPGWAQPKGKPVTAGPKAPKVHAAPKTPNVHAGPKAGTPGAGHKPATAGAKAQGPKTTPGSQATKPAHAPKSSVPKNPELTARLQGMLPAGMTVEQAAAGFKNQGQFIAAVNVAKAHDISFTDLKANMVDGGLSLGQSIHKLKPDLDADVEAARATRLAEEQLEPR